MWFSGYWEKENDYSKVIVYIIKAVFYKLNCNNHTFLENSIFGANGATGLFTSVRNLLKLTKDYRLVSFIIRMSQSSIAGFFSLKRSLGKETITLYISLCKAFHIAVSSPNYFILNSKLLLEKM